MNTSPETQEHPSSPEYMADLAMRLGRLAGEYSKRMQALEATYRPYYDSDADQLTTNDETVVAALQAHGAAFAPGEDALKALQDALYR
jgi:hypothetical protein